MFGATSAAQPSVFGAATQQQPAGSLFGTQSTAVAFGQPQQQGQSLFGAGATGFGAPANTGFAAFGQQQQQQNPFGGTANVFGAKTATTTAPAFGGFNTTNTFGGFSGGKAKPFKALKNIQNYALVFHAKDCNFEGTHFFIRGLIFNCSLYL